MNHVAHPDIPGLTYQKDLGSGGFADVYLFRRTSPDRLVAVKVLRTTDMSDKLAKRFEAEANAMAALNHPHIAQVYSAGFTTDGRPYIEMAYYPAGSLDDRVRQAPLSVPDTIRIGVQLCSAIETAHRLDPPLLHRDIKPANVLIDEYGDPVLTDFGIASRMNDEEDEDTSLSVYWAPPEAMFSTSPIDKRSDVYALGAMMWHLLVGRAPYVVPGGDNRPTATMLRTRDLPVPSTGRPDVPASLDRLLGQCMSKDPKLRPSSAAALARALNNIEQHEYGFGRVTPFKLKMEPPAPKPATAESAVDRTVFKGAPQVVPAQLAPAGNGFTVVRPNPDERPLLQEEPADRGSKTSLVIAISLVVVIVTCAIMLWVYQSRQPVAPPPTVTSHSQEPAEIGADMPPGPVTITCDRGDNDAIDCTWTYENGLTTDAYKVLLPNGSEVASNITRYTTYAPDGNAFCIRVKVVRHDGRFPGDWSDEGCA